jgi:hypothetical protein
MNGLSGFFLSTLLLTGLFLKLTTIRQQLGTLWTR